MLLLSVTVEFTGFDERGTEVYPVPNIAVSLMFYRVINDIGIRNGPGIGKFGDVDVVAQASNEEAVAILRHPNVFAAHNPMMNAIASVLKCFADGLKCPAIIM